MGAYVGAFLFVIIFLLVKTNGYLCYLLLLSAPVTKRLHAIFNRFTNMPCAIFVPFPEALIAEMRKLACPGVPQIVEAEVSNSCSS